MGFELISNAPFDAKIHYEAMKKYGCVPSPHPPSPPRAQNLVVPQRHLNNEWIIVPVDIYWSIEEL